MASISEGKGAVAVIREEGANRIGLFCCGIGYPP